MAAGTQAVIDLPRRTSFLGMAGSLVVTSPADSGEVHLLESVQGRVTDRVVTGLPADLHGVGLNAAAPGALLLELRTGAENAYAYSTAVVDLATAAVTRTATLDTDAPWSVRSALSATHSVSVSPSYTGRTTALQMTARDTGVRTTVPAGPLYEPLVGLVGTWAVYGNETQLIHGDSAQALALKAMPITGGPSRTVLDHATSLTATPDGALLVAGGTVAKGEGIYRVAAGADGVPVAELVASTGLPTAVTLLETKVPPVAELDRKPWTAAWRLSRRNVEMTVTVRHAATGAVDVSYLYPDNEPGAGSEGWVSWTWDGVLADAGRSMEAFNGAYTWQIKAAPLNGIGPALTASGAFTVQHGSAPHDYNDNGSPDLLARDASGVLWREDTVDQYTADGNTQLSGRDRVRIGGGWNTYDRITAAGNLGGASHADLLARDRSGVLWLYLGKGNGTFTARQRVGGGWNSYNLLSSGMGDVTGDGHADLLARDSAGTLWLYKGTGNWKAPFTARQKIGGGWNTYDQIVSTGNIGGATAGDLIARDKAGILWLYLSNGNGSFAARKKIGGGWNAYRHIIGIGDSNHDGKPDLLAKTNDGDTYRYPGTGDWRAPFGARQHSTALPPSNDDTTVS
ncbi:FG-GAP repeat domain-containing protein [Streptomyces melanogenes]|uniref:FG-GAP repeat domain-containing protein n=1 Tax=Streptomyces melanogenes TaxID=67326 RepID=UPI0037A560EE